MHTCIIHKRTFTDLQRKKQSCSVRDNGIAQTHPGPDRNSSIGARVWCLSLGGHLWGEMFKDPVDQAWSLKGMLPTPRSSTCFLQCTTSWTSCFLPRQEIDEAEGVRAVHKAFASGINYFDTAPFYGLTRSEKVWTICSLLLFSSHNWAPRSCQVRSEPLFPPITLARFLMKASKQRKSKPSPVPIV